MSTPMFDWPASTRVDQAVPKARVLSYAPQRRGLKDRLSQQLDGLTWSCKLSPETINLPASTDVAELQVFTLQLKAGITRADPLLLRAIDQAIPSPLLFEVRSAKGICIAAAHKRPSEADASRWVLGEHMVSEWLPLDTPRQPLPVALDLGGLYRALLRALIPIPARAGEGLRAQLERLALLRVAERDCMRLSKQLSREAQFNRKVALNQRLRERQEELERLRQ
ncbi:MAG: DUF4391 domain-containing protein [Lysobacterales bacterium]